MEKIINIIQDFIRSKGKQIWWWALGALLIIVGCILFLKWLGKANTVSIGTDQRIDITSQQISSIESIGQWEFLAINDEELVDTIKYRFLADKELVRIYYGTLRLGVDLHKAKPKWLRIENDSVVVATLPNIDLLDRNFIDEARSESFFEKGKWTPEDRERLHNIAYQKMLKRCFTKENIAAAESNAQQQFEKMLRAMGYKHVRIEFEKTDSTKIKD